MIKPEQTGSGPEKGGLEKNLPELSHKGSVCKGCLYSTLAFGQGDVQGCLCRLLPGSLVIYLMAAEASVSWKPTFLPESSLGVETSVVDSVKCIHGDS